MEKVRVRGGRLRAQCKLCSGVPKPQKCVEVICSYHIDALARRCVFGRQMRDVRVRSWLYLIPYSPSCKFEFVLQNADAEFKGTLFCSLASCLMSWASNW